jgi:hypothetical protein
MTDGAIFPELSCVREIAAIRSSEPVQFANSPLLAPWGVQIAGSFSKAAAVAAYARARDMYSALCKKILRAGGACVVLRG